MSTTTYSSAKVAVIVAGVPLSGLADGTFVTAEREVDSFTKKVGADGEVARSASANKTGSITITLMQGSTGNELLSGLNLADENTLTGMFPVNVVDTNGTTVVFSDTSWIRKTANPEFAEEAGNREWVIDCSILNVFNGSANS